MLFCSEKRISLKGCLDGLAQLVKALGVFPGSGGVFHRQRMAIRARPARACRLPDPSGFFLDGLDHALPVHAYFAGLLR